MPYFSIKLHLWGLEWIIRWNYDIDVKYTSSVTSVNLNGLKNMLTYGSKDFTLPVSEIITYYFSFNNLLTIGLKMVNTLIQIFD